MHTAVLSLSVLLAVALSALLSRVLPLPLPRPLLQIALGALVALVSGQQMELDSDVFFLLFVPPLLFFDGWRIPKDRLFRDRGPILGLALGLVFLTVLGIGYFLHWMIPALPLGVAFAVAAVVSPTDPIALSGIAQRVPVPARLMSILEGESLLNDASGLVCLRFAIAAVMTGSFSLGQAALSFAWIALAGVAIGAALCWAIVRTRTWIARRFGEESWSDVLVTLLVPFAVYLAAEHAGASGILASAAAGITMTFAAARTDLQAVTRMRGRVIWEMLEYTLNGIVFVLLGAQLPRILENAPRTAAQAAQGGGGPWVLLGHAAALMLGLLLIRFCWAWLALQLTLFRERRAQRGDPQPSPPLRIVAAMTCAGARGAITLAGVLSLPLALPDGSAFPARDLAILLAVGVILLSLVLASAALPPLLADLRVPSGDSTSAHAERAVRIAAAEAALARIDEVTRELARHHPGEDRYGEVAHRVAARYRTRIEAVAADDDEDEPVATSHSHRIEHRLQLAGIEAERGTVRAYLKQRKIDSELAHRLLHELDLADVKAELPR